MVETGGAVAEILQRMIADRAPGACFCPTGMCSCIASVSRKATSRPTMTRRHQARSPLIKNARSPTTRVLHASSRPQARERHVC